MNTLADEIRTEMELLHKEKPWVMVAGFIGKSPAYAYRVVRGDLRLSDDVMDAWIRNYRQQYAGKATVRVCPTCGDAHVVADCHGKLGTPVIQSASLHPFRQRQHRVRREMTPAQAAIWDSLSKEERNAIMGILSAE